MFIVENLLSYNLRTFSYSRSLDSDFDCVHFTMQPFFSPVWSPGKTINLWIHWQQILPIHNAEICAWVFICTLTTNFKKR